MLQYNTRFGARVISIWQKLEERGLIDKQLDEHYEHPRNPIDITIVAQRLGALAEKLPPDS